MELFSTTPLFIKIPVLLDSVFHAYGQNGFQVVLPPAQRPGFGLSDGKAASGLWSALKPLIAPSRSVWGFHQRMSLSAFWIWLNRRWVTVKHGAGSNTGWRSCGIGRAYLRDQLVSQVEPSDRSLAKGRSKTKVEEADWSILELEKLVNAREARFDNLRDFSSCRTNRQLPFFQLENGRCSCQTTRLLNPSEDVVQHLGGRCKGKSSQD
ncbi:hypothetical protein BU15DRAFT_62876 [Melanogaster broomeanus]|nr:hypothetical protein BU15DRAFT_62876 [Melanogaster broomeanus]